jgi:hypothetical protein
MMKKKEKYTKSINSMPETIFDNSNLTINTNGVFIKPLYKNIAFCEMNRIELVKGHVIKNWKISFILGLGLAIFFSMQIIKNTPHVNPTSTTNLRSQMLIYLSQFVFLFFGTYLLYLSLSKKPVIKIITLDNYEYLYPLSNNKNQLSQIVSFLKNSNVTLKNMLPY